MQSPSIRSDVKPPSVLSQPQYVEDAAPPSPQPPTPQPPSPQPPSPQPPSRQPSPPALPISPQSQARSRSPSPQSPGPPPTSPRLASPGRNEDSSIKSYPKSPKNLSINTSDLEPRGMKLTEDVNELASSVKALADELNPQSPVLGSNINKIAAMGKILTQEANALRESIKSLSDDIIRTKLEMSEKCEDVNFPYHLFLIEIIINKIHMKCECFELDYNNLVITATFLGKQPIILYDPSYGKIDNFSKLNAGKSTLFAMTYDKICSIREFEIVLQLTKRPPCSSCVTKIAETRMDFSREFTCLREELCQKWREEQPDDNILCTTSTPLSKNMYYLSCNSDESADSIGVIEVTVRMSFLGKEITTALCASPKPHGASFLLKQDNGITMYSCHKVEMDDQGKILLDEDVMTRKPSPRQAATARTESPMSSCISRRSIEPYVYSNNRDGHSKYDEIFTKLNANELKIRVPKSTKVERMGKYDKIQEICTCESTPYNANEQIQFELPRDLCNGDKAHNTYSSNLKYTYNGCDRTCAAKDNKIVNVTPSNCPAPVDMKKIIHPQKDVFILKIGKKLETKDKKTDLEIELVTPKAPPEKPVENSNISQQCSSGELKAKDKKKKKKKDKGKGKGKTKGAKTKKPKKKK